MKQFLKTAVRLLQEQDVPQNSNTDNSPNNPPPGGGFPNPNNYPGHPSHLGLGYSVPPNQYQQFNAQISQALTLYPYQQAQGHDQYITSPFGAVTPQRNTPEPYVSSEARHNNPSQAPPLPPRSSGSSLPLLPRMEQNNSSASSLPRARPNAGEFSRAQSVPGISKRASIKKILSLDGGGVRGLSEIMILKYLMMRLEKIRGWKVEPWQEFDMIGGTSTGG